MVRRTKSEGGTVSLEQIYYVSQLISTLALLVTVIYLGRQTHLVAKGQLAQMHQARSEQYQDIILRMTDASFTEFVAAGIRGDKSLPDSQVQQFYYFGVSILRIFEELFRQNREGTIADDRWQSSEKTLIGIMRSPGYRAVYTILRGSLDKDFEQLLDDCIRANPAPVPLDLATLWRNALPTTPQDAAAATGQ